MDNERKLRLIQVAKEFKVGLNTIVDHLQKKGITTDGTPNTKVTDEMYAILEKEFGTNRSSGNERNAVREKIAQKQAAVTIESPKQQAKEEEELVVKSNVISVKDEIQKRVDEAGLEIVEARITYLAYAPEIAAVMLQRQQASAVVDARKLIVDGAVGMVEMALERLNEKGTVQLDEERKAAMVSNLLVVLCGNKDAQPIVNSGSLY